MVTTRPPKTIVEPTALDPVANTDTKLLDLWPISKGPSFGTGRGKVPFYQDKQKTPLHILIDSSGLAVHAGQLRRAPKSRDYRKLHLCVDEQTGEVVAGVVGKVSIHSPRRSEGRLAEVLPSENSTGTFQSTPPAEARGD